MSRVECKIRALVMLPVRELAVSVCLSVCLCIKLFVYCRP